ncbi:hypothetical protein PG985_008416 [Apiospora marii]|uniref:2EXR domain-containing protein n=1 Tax=Apiospora marii TaxID=335849 RepID=A0ABR1SU90_9PEZI
MACRFRIKFQVTSDGSPATATAPTGREEDSPTFTLFSSLPPELRLKIWDFAASVPRIVLASCITRGLDAEGEGDQGATEAQQLKELSSRRACRFVPAILHANHEARARALERHYSLTFSWKVPLVFASLNGDSTHHHQNGSAYLSGSPVVDDAATGGGRGSRRRSSGDGGMPTWSHPRVYFNFERDALYLLGELEPYDSFGFNSPMTYFLRKEDTERVRCVAVAFSALKYGETGSQQIFGSLFHVVDRFPLCSTATPAPTPTPTATTTATASTADGDNGSSSARTADQQQQPQQPHVLVCVTPGDEWTHALLGGTEPLVKGHRGEWDQQRDFGHMPQSQRHQERQQRQSENGGGGGGGPAGGSAEQREEEEPEEPENVVQKIWTDWYRGSIVKSRMADVQFKLITEDELESVVTGQPSANAAASTYTSNGSGSRGNDYRELHDALGRYLHGAA